MRGNTLFRNNGNKTTFNNTVDIDRSDEDSNHQKKYIYYPVGLKKKEHTTSAQKINQLLGPEALTATSIPKPISSEQSDTKVNVGQLVEKTLDSKIPDLPEVAQSFSSKTPDSELLSGVAQSFSSKTPEKISDNNVKKEEMPKLSEPNSATVENKNDADDKEDTVTSPTMKREKFEEQLLFNLNIISELKKDDKLSFCNNQFSIDDPNYMQGVTRWWYGEDRSKTLEKLNDVINETFRYIEETYTNEMDNNTFGNFTNEKSKSVLYENNSERLQKFNLALNKTCSGLEKLKNTYNVDTSMTTGLNLLISKIETRLKKINEILKIR